MRLMKSCYLAVILNTEVDISSVSICKSDNCINQVRIRQLIFITLKLSNQIFFKPDVQIIAPIVRLLLYIAHVQYLLN